MFNKVAAFAKEHKDVLIKASGTLIGALVGIFIVGKFAPDPEVIPIVVTVETETPEA